MESEDDDSTILQEESEYSKSKQVNEYRNAILASIKT